ncbi:hypothetical protein Glove_134g57 [Diversispora epigaea]|uniref:BTB domain-containing protein n=1 Tax=Diversispora epigaea TaxID=1348612 RepID=A0A397IX07_9GLOM|nr:hypothetical protein Glove_134g57 [Diversispora epigaea]
MTQNSRIHYYSDGDILIIVNDTRFRLHRNIMGLASKIFQDMFNCATPSPQNDYNNNGIYDKIPEVTLEGESTALTFEDVISFIYPNTFIPIGWNNVSEFLRIADKYMMDSVLSASKTFLEREFRKKPLYALYLADRYLFREIYKESTKLVFEKFPDYKRLSLFQELSIITRSKLINQYTKYTNALQKLSKIDFTSGYLHCTECSSNLNHNNEINEKFSERVRQVQVLPLPLPLPPPSLTRKIFFQSIGNNICDSQFMVHQLSRKFNKHFGKFEPLECKKYYKDAKFYLFIELE